MRKQTLRMGATLNLMVSVDRAERILRQGFEEVRSSLNDIPEGSTRERALAVADKFGQIAWAATNADQIVLRDGQPSRLYLAVVREADVSHHVASTFSTDKWNQGDVLIKVRAVSLSPIWAGLGVLHELSHAFDLLEGLEPWNPAPNDYWDGEARAFHIEAASIDAHTAGRLSEAIGRRRDEIDDMSVPDLANLPGGVMADMIERDCFGPRRRPPASDNEAMVRNGALRCAIALAAATGESMPHKITRPEDSSWLIRQVIGD